jgi:23S rRNA pseudouridine2605 synthase
MDLVRGVHERLYPVGRLDFMSEGLLLLSNDGALAQKLTHAASHVPKTYEVKVSGKPTEDAIGRLRAGIVLPPEARLPRSQPEGPVKTAPARITLLRDAPNPWYEVTLTEGRNRQIRRMFKQVGHDVEKIKRVRYGPLELDVAPGQYRQLRPDEVIKLSRTGRPRPSRDYGAARGGEREKRNFSRDRAQRPAHAGRPASGKGRPQRSGKRGARPRNSH